MKRNSFLRNERLEYLIEKKTWGVPGIGAQNIGFKIGQKSGLILQSPSPTPAVIAKYYRHIATYNNPFRNDTPSKNKVNGVTRQIALCKETIGVMPTNIFQVGCSDGYTLHRFNKAGATHVAGVDPSEACKKVAYSLYKLDTIIGSFEEIKIKKHFDLMIFTHVLEHLYDPLKSLKKSASLQNENGYLLVEVPLFERERLFPPGYFTFEHLNYFSEGTLLELLSKAGYSPQFIGKYFYNENYPVVTVIAKKDSNVLYHQAADYFKNKKEFGGYIKKEAKTWKKKKSKILNEIKKTDKVFIYGCGIHTTQLLAFTSLKDEIKIEGLLDSNPSKWGTNIDGIICKNIKDIEITKDTAIIISSYASQEEIYSSLKNTYKCKLLKLYT